jgi:hypothetical protein
MMSRSTGLFDARRTIMRLMLAACLCITAAACSPSDQSRARQDANAAGHDLANAAREVKNDPSVKQAGADAKHAANDAATAVRKGAAQAEIKTGEALIDAGDKAKTQARADRSGQSQN